LKKNKWKKKNEKERMKKEGRNRRSG